jgi:hypothetical protein
MTFERSEASAVFQLETNEKQIPLPRLRDRDDMTATFSATCWWDFLDSATAVKERLAL